MYRNCTDLKIIKTFLNFEFVFVSILIFTECLHKKIYALNPKMTLLKIHAKKYIHY